MISSKCIIVTTISLQMCSFTFENPQKSLRSIHIYLLRKIPISNSKAFKIILSVGHPLTPQTISESGNGTLCMQLQATLTHQILYTLKEFLLIKQSFVY